MSKIAYLDCFAGVSGNMLLGAVIGAGAPAAWVRGEVRKVITGFRLKVTADHRHWLAGTHVRVEYPKRGQPHRRLADIEKMISKSGLSERTREQSLLVFRTLARAEAAAHGITPREVHFHEVGAVDAIVDVVGTVAGLERLGVETVVCSALPMSGGEVECAHGTLPVPAPATLELIRSRGVPVRGVPVEAELVTPTGAALVTALADRFGPMPAMNVVRTGVGLGDRDLPDRPNLMRIIIGDTVGPGRELVQLEAAIDDMEPERYDFLMERLHQTGALEVLMVPAQMKKNRPGTLVRVLAAPENQAGAQTELFNHSTTLGVRAWPVSRAALERRSETVTTRYGKVAVKFALRPDGTLTPHIEYDDLKRAAGKAGVSLAEIEKEVLAARRRAGK